MKFSRTNIVMDEELVKEAMSVTGIKTRRELVSEALKALIQIRGRKLLSDLRGKIHFARGYDHKRLRRRFG